MKRSFTAALGRASALLLAGAFTLALSSVITGCSGVTTFKDTTPINVKGPAAEPPPPPPEEKKKRVEVKKDRIEINEKIQFELNQAVIKPESDDLLGEIIAVLKDNPQIKKVEIVGHTSDEGSDSYNQTLSENRAKAVLDYFVAHGIDTGRLTSKGKGESSPLADNATEDGRELNRRVEFLIVEQDDPEAAEKKADKKEEDKAEDKAEDKDKADKKADKKKADKKKADKKKATKGETP